MRQALRAVIQRLDRRAPSAACVVAAVLLAGAATDPGARAQFDDLLVGSPAEESPLGDFLAGNAALDRGELRAATTFFESALAHEPDNVELQRRVFLLNLAGGRFDEAVAQAKELVTADDTEEEALLLLALARAKAGDFAGARERFDEIGSAGLAAVVLPVLDAWAAFGAGDQEAALATLGDIAEGDVMGPLRTYHTAMVHGLSGELNEAAAALEEQLDDDGRTPPRLVRALGSILYRSGDAEAAEDLYRSHIERAGGDLVLERDLAAIEDGDAPSPPFQDPLGAMADALLGVAEALERQRGGTRTILYAQLASFLNPKLAEAKLLIGRALAAQGNEAEAIEVFEAVPADSPLRWEARLERARALHRMDEKEQSYDALQEMVDERPERVEAAMTLGDLLRRDEEYARAAPAYTAAIERLPELGSAYWSLLYSRGIAYERTDRWAQAEADFLKALELEPEQPYVLNYLGYSWVEKGLNLDRAKEMLHRAVELRPEDGFIVDSLGWVYYQLGDYERAVEHLERAIELEPGDPVINDHLGDAYWRVGRQREARFQWRHALALGAEPEEVEKLQAKLQSGLGAAEEL